MKIKTSNTNVYKLGQHNSEDVHYDEKENDRKKYINGSNGSGVKLRATIPSHILSNVNVYDQMAMIK